MRTNESVMGFPATAIVWFGT